MNNTYKNGNRVLILKKFYSIKKNDILIFQNDKETMIKRCVGLPGDSIKIINGKIYSNNSLIQLPEKAIKGDFSNLDVYSLSEIYNTYNQNWSLNNFGTYIIPKKGMKILLTPENILLYGKLIKKENLNKMIPEKKKSYVFQKNYVFLMGDNRAESVDSRFFGPIMESDLKGKVILNIF